MKLKSRILLIVDALAVVIGLASVAAIMFGWLPPRPAIIGAGVAAVYLGNRILFVVITPIARLLKAGSMKRLDARGIEVEIFPPDGKPSSIGLTGQQRLELRRLVMENPPPRRAFVGCLLGILLYIPGITLIVVMPLNLYIDLLIILIVSLLAAILSLPGRRIYLHHASDLVAQMGICPSCGYSLKHLNQDDDCVVCPECGAAWRTVSSPAIRDASHGMNTP